MGSCSASFMPTTGNRGEGPRSQRRHNHKELAFYVMLGVVKLGKLYNPQVHVPC
jgi:hypothetical protein